MRLGLDGRVAIVTGASRGIGRATAAAFVAEKAQVIGCARRDFSADGVLAVTGDVTDPALAAWLVHTAAERFGRLDIVVNNAGSTAPRRLTSLTDDDWRAAYDLHVVAAVRLALAAVPVMRERGWGRIVNIASTHARQPDSYFAAYSAAKAALVNVTQTLSDEFAADGIFTTCVLPGLVHTDLVDENTAAVAKATGLSTDEVLARTLQDRPIPAGRMGDANEVASIVAFCASEAASWLTGTTLTVDGGTTPVIP